MHGSPGSTALAQLPRLSAYDPGAQGEGSLDPMGLSAPADRIADVLAPGVRARMSQPRFVTLSALGALACQELSGLSADDGTTADLAFEWLIVEAMVRHPVGGGDAPRRTAGLPGNEKAQRAIRSGLRVSKRTYLNGPRVFGFTGVYRPLSRDLRALAMGDGPGEESAALIRAWELDQGLDGYLDGIDGTAGGRLRKGIVDVCKRSLEQSRCEAPPNGGLLRLIAESMAPKAAGPRERAALRGLIQAGAHEVRNELVERLGALPSALEASQAELAARLSHGASVATRRALRCAIDYETAATALDNGFRRLIAHVAQHHGAAVRRCDAHLAPGLEALARHVHERVGRAIDSADDLDDVTLSTQTRQSLRLFTNARTAQGLLETLLARHEEVQANKRRLTWIDQLGASLIVRTPYRDQQGDLDDAVWTHPMRLRTLAVLLAETAP